MNTVDRVTSFTELVTASFENAMGTMERVHQASVDLSVALFSQLGFWQDEAERYRQGHAKMVHTVYGSIVEVNNEFGTMIVGQAENLSRFLRSFLGADEQPEADDDASLTDDAIAT